jgi:HSP20 family protein
MVDLGTLTPGRDDVFELIIKAELPGVQENDVDVTVSGDTLTINAEKKVEHEKNGDDGRYLERRTGLFSRSIKLPFEIKDEEMDATFEEGVLRIRLHKVSKVQKIVRRVEVNRIRKGSPDR